MRWMLRERPTSWGLRSILKAAIAELEAGRRPEMVAADLLEALACERPPSA